MNNWNNLEERIHQWRPRSPSPNIEKRLFGPPTRGGAFGGISWGWQIAAALGCLALGLSAFNLRSAGFPGAGVELPVIGAGASPHYAAYLSPGFSVAQNTLRNATIAWTNSKRFTSPLEIFPAMETNQFKQ